MAAATLRTSENECRASDINRRIDVCDDIGNLKMCYYQCLSDDQFREMEAACDNGDTYMASCTAKTCATVKLGNKSDPAVQYSLNRGMSVMMQCTDAQADKITKKLEKASDAGKKSVKFCCNESHVGAIVGGVIAGVVVLAVIGLFVWMYIAKKWLFAPKSKTQVVEERPQGAPDALDGAAPAADE